MMTLKEFEEETASMSPEEYKTWFSIHAWDKIDIGEIVQPCIKLRGNKKVALMDGHIYTTDKECTGINNKEKSVLMEKFALIKQFDKLSEQDQSDINVCFSNERKDDVIIWYMYRYFEKALW